jgi:hypothetical protein
MAVRSDAAFMEHEIKKKLAYIAKSRKFVVSIRDMLAYVEEKSICQLCGGQEEQFGYKHRVWCPVSFLSYGLDEAEDELMEEENDLKTDDGECEAWGV